MTTNDETVAGATAPTYRLLWRQVPPLVCSTPECESAPLVAVAVALFDQYLHLRYWCARCYRAGDTMYSLAGLRAFGDSEMPWTDGRTLPPAPASVHQEDEEGAGDDKVVDIGDRRGGDEGE